MEWELIEKKAISRGMYARRHNYHYEWGYLTKKGGLRILYKDDADGLQTVEILACVNMTQKQIAAAMKKFHAKFPKQDEKTRQQILAVRKKAQKNRNKLLREIKKKNEERERKEKERENKIRQMKDKYAHIK